MTGYLETILVQEQRQAENLTSFEVYPFPPKLKEVFYPLDFRGDPMAPELLVMHSRSHMFNMPRCFHGRDSRLVFGRNGKVFLVCGEDGGCPCAFFIDIRALLYTGIRVQCVRYSLRLGTSTSSGGASTPDSLPSLAPSPPSEDQRMLDVPDSQHNDSRALSRRVDAGVPGTIEERNLATTPRALIQIPGVRVELSSLSLPGNLYQAPTWPTAITRSHDSSSPLGDGDAYMKGREDMDAVTFFDGLQRSSNSLILGPSDWTVGRFVASDTVRRSCLPTIEPRRRGKIEDLCDEDVFPLLARPDGMCSLASCIDPVTREFSNDLFLSQIIKDSFGNEINY